MFKHSQLTKLYVENFQTIGNYVELPISPITILVGPNSVGKSSIIDCISVLSYIMTDVLVPKEAKKNIKHDIFDKNLRFGENRSTLGFQIKFNPKNFDRDYFQGNYRDSHKYDFLREVFYKTFTLETELYANHAFVTDYDHYFIINFKVEIERERVDPFNEYTYRYKSMSLEVDGKNIFKFSENLFSLKLKNYPFRTEEMKGDNIVYDDTEITLKHSDSDIFSNGKTFFYNPEDFLTKYYFDCGIFFKILQHIKLLCNFDEKIALVPASRNVPRKNETIFVLPPIDGVHNDAPKFLNESGNHIVSSICSEFSNDPSYNIFYNLAESVAHDKYSSLYKSYIASNKSYECDTCDMRGFAIEAYGTRKDEKNDFADINNDDIIYCPYCGNFLDEWSEMENIYINDLDDDTETLKGVNNYLSDIAGNKYTLDAEIDFITSEQNLYLKNSPNSPPKNVVMIVRLLLLNSSGEHLEFQDVGSGISYCLPVLALACNHSSLNIIQQPELHTHPSIQSKLSNIFIKNISDKKTENSKIYTYKDYINNDEYITKSIDEWDNQNDMKKAYSKNDINIYQTIHQKTSFSWGYNLQYLIETHSEHLILGLLKNIRDKFNKRNNHNISSDDISILYFEPNDKNKETIIKNIRITDDGDFLDKLPKSFFDEREKLLFDE